MSINVTVSGNPINICRRRMVLSDLDQIKKNERERRRRLRLEQVRQQSKEISNRLLERAKNIAREELSRLEKDGQSELKKMHERKIMEIQRKYQEDMEDIGLAHDAAALQPDANVILQEERVKNRLAALKRGREATQQLVEMEKAEDPQVARQERIRQVREVENLRSSLVAQLPKKSQVQKPQDSNSDSLLEDSKTEAVKKSSPRKKKGRKTPKKTASKFIKSNVKVIGSGARMKSSFQTTPKQKRKSRSSATRITTVADVHDVPEDLEEEADEIECLEDEESEQTPRKTPPVSCGVSCNVDQTARYNPEDYTGNRNTNESSSSTSVSDDSSYFSDSGEQSARSKISKPVSAESCKVHVYDHSTRQRNTYDRPCGTVERVDVRNEPSARQHAERVEMTESAKVRLNEARRLNAQRRGEDAMLREKVRRDYDALMENLEHLAKEERKLKASQVHAKHGEELHLRGDQRREHQARMDRAFREILNKSQPPEETQVPVERVITLPPRKPEERKDPTPCGTWQEPPFRDSRVNFKDKAETIEENEELSREEQILEMLKKVERQKRLLLEEFGANLPSDIINASLKSFTEKGSGRPPTERTQDVPKSPEIKVINLSSGEENSKGSENVKTLGTKKKVPPVKRKQVSPSKMTEIAVQTIGLEKTIDAKDKCVQVELKLDEMVEEISKIPHPIEPKVTVITPTVEESSSGSSTSIFTDLVIDIDKNEVKVSPRKKSDNLRASRRFSPAKVSQKSRSVPSSKASSPVKKVCKSLPGSRLASPKKGKYLTSTPSRTINIQVSRNGLNVQLDPRNIAVDASTERAEIFVDEERPYRLQSRSKRTIRIRDTSEDTSTSFASPPPAKPGTLAPPIAGTTPILELLDSSINETTKFSRRDVSPVSTPETPSPRTMRLPSNVPHPERIGRMLTYENDSTLPSSTLNDGTTSTDQSNSLRPEEKEEEICTCRNPECRLMHSRIQDVEDDALKSCPEILKKYEDLQNMCSERIASLTDLIEKVRSDQRGLEFSVISSRDETRLMDFPPVQPVRDGLQSVRRLVESIETIHNQLARTLLESQRIITNQPVERETLRTDTATSTTEPSAENNQQRPKPKIVSQERVNVQLNRFKTQEKPQTMLLTTPERTSWPPSKIPVKDDDVIGKLSREILEQSREKTNAANFGKDGSFFATKGRALLAKDDDNYEDEKSAKGEEELLGDSKREEKKVDFVPLLAGIPKGPKYLAAINGRGKPPVTMLSGPYRTELDGLAHELSTIIEFDTPDTGNRSGGTARSPGGKSKKAGNNWAFSKPSIHVAPLPVQENRKSTSPERPEEENKIVGGWTKDETNKENVQLNFSTREKETSTSSNSFSALSGVSEITSTPSSEFFKYVSSPEEMETALKKLGLGWAVTTLKKTREASALTSSSNSDVTPINTARKLLSPVKKGDGNNGLPELSDVSSISMKEASKSTERAVLMKGRTSTPNLRDSRSNSSQCATSNSSGSISLAESKKSEDL